MKKNYFLFMMAMAALTGKSIAQQPCYTDEMRKAEIAAHPDLLIREAEYEKQIQAALQKIDYSKAAKTTTTDESGNVNFWYDIPIVVHIVHDYNAYTSTFAGDYIPDNFIYDAVKEWNVVYAKQNADTIDVIQPFKKYIGNPHIRLHLATIDPTGNPTTGITRTRSYLTYSGGQMAKYQDWAPSSYLNLWFINKMSDANGNAAAYAHMPADVTYIPFYDGVISLAGYMNNGSKTMNHEIGHCFNLIHVWGGTNNPEVACGDDNVDDTPPTKGHNPQGCTAAIYDTTCSTNYYKIYSDIVTGAFTMVDYPDTNNSQNIMDYTYCDKMFSIGQCERMHVALNSSVASRNNLWSQDNLTATGALLPRPDLAPVPDFTATNLITSSYLTKNANFTFPGNSIKITNQTMGDTVTNLEWTFTNGASTPTSTSLTNFNNSFSQPGWVDVTMKATGNGTGTVTKTFEKAIFVADNEGRDAHGYVQDFSPTGDRDKWPFFNYYNNEFKWQLANVGMYDNSCIMYQGYDYRLNPTLNLAPTTGTPKGDFDDLFSIPVNLSNFPDGCNLNFYYSSASRTALSSDINDTLIIDYSVNKSVSWNTLARLGKGSLISNGAIYIPFAPTAIGDWTAKTIPLPAAARTPYTTFRFRYKPGANATTLNSTGNNFYMDNIHFSSFPAEAFNVKMGNVDVAIVPNPTHGDATVVIKDGNNTSAHITVSDITGKVVYTVTQQLSGNESQVKIPHEAIATQGMYLVQTVTGNQVNTQKLVVY